MSSGSYLRDVAEIVAELRELIPDAVAAGPTSGEVAEADQIAALLGEAADRLEALAPSKETSMKTTWIVESVHATVDKTKATLKRVEWFKTNPEWEAHLDDVPMPEGISEFLDCEPDDEGAEAADHGDHITIDIDGFPVGPGENVVIDFGLGVTVPRGR
jgi:hypothetical protein